MKDVLWYVLAGTRGGANRARILRLLEERPRNANQTAEALDVDYKTARHHLEVLVDNGVVTQAGDGYGAVYRISDRAETHWETIEEILGTIDEP